MSRETVGLRYNTPMHLTGALAFKEALNCAVRGISICLAWGVRGEESPAGDWQIR